MMIRGFLIGRLRRASTINNGSSASKLLPLSSVSQLSNSSNLLTLKCTEISAIGGIANSVSRELSKVEIASRYKVMSRDLRKLDDRFQHQLPAILVRPSAILCNLGKIKAVIFHDRVLLVESSGSAGSAGGTTDDKYAWNRLLFELQSKCTQQSTHSSNPSQQQDPPMELRALEVLLSTTLAELRDDADKLLSVIERYLYSQLAIHNVDQTMLTSLLRYSKLLTQLQDRAKSVCVALQEVLDSDQDLAAMYLTQKQISGTTERDVNDHEDAEILLETYLKETDEVLARISRLDDEIHTTEDIINISLDSQRNTMLFMELKLAMGTFSVANGALVASVFGMNLTSGMEAAPYLFTGVGVGCVLLSGSLYRVLARGMKKALFNPHSGITGSNNVIESNTVNDTNR